MIEKKHEKNKERSHLVFEPYAMKVARAVLRGGKLERVYLSQLDTLVVFAENAECHRLEIYCSL